MNNQTAQAQVQTTPPASLTQPNQQGAPNEALASQNVFTLLGVTDGTEEQKEEFLDELQQVIWEDFLEYDAKLLITAEEYQKLQEMLSSQNGDSFEQQEAVVVFLEKLIPELEDIMLEKALELKADLFKERIGGMKEYFSDNQEAMQKIQRAEELVLQERWHSAIELLNTIS